VVYDRGTMDLDLQAEGGASSRNTVLNNLFLRGPSYSRDTSPIYIRTDGALGLGAGSRVYQTGNVAQNYVREIVGLTGGDTITGLLGLGSYPVWNSGLSVQNNANNVVYDRVLNKSGARPSDRDSVDRRIVTQVRNRNGQIINCVAANGSTRCSKNAGGWPTLAHNTRRLTLPANPNTVTASGYTNLELWLHSLDQQLAGVVQAKAPAPPQTVSVN
jgi:hypothetical protein